MRRAPLMLGLAVLTITACGGLVPSYDEEDPVIVTVTCDARLNDYSGEPHALVVYAFKLDDPDLFRGADEASLISEIGKPVAGGVVHQNRTFSPGDKGVSWRIGAMGQEKYKWVGIYAAYRDAASSRRSVVEIPPNGKLVLDLAARSIEKFVKEE